MGTQAVAASAFQAADHADIGGTYPSVGNSLPQAGTMQRLLETVVNIRQK